MVTMTEGSVAPVTWVHVCVGEVLRPRVFFSRRSRHTRCSRDWSSDVCSSDVKMCPPKLQPSMLGPHRQPLPRPLRGSRCCPCPEPLRQRRHAARPPRAPAAGGGAGGAAGGRPPPPARGGAPSPGAPPPPPRRKIVRASSTGTAP